MTDDIKTLREFIRKRTSKQTPHGHQAIAALERLEKELYLLRRIKEANDSKPDFEKFWEEASNECDALRAKFEKTEKVLAGINIHRLAEQRANDELGAKLEKTKEALLKSKYGFEIVSGKKQCLDNLMSNKDVAEECLKTADAILAELSADAPAQPPQISDEILRAAQRVIYRVEECGALRDPEATDFGSSLAALRAAIFAFLNHAAGETL